MGIAFNLEKDSVGIIILGDYSTITEGMQVRATGRIASVPVGDGLIGRVVNALGEPVRWKRRGRFQPVFTHRTDRPECGRTPGCGYPGSDRYQTH
jgi:F-type H+-transporting ATPase subunit alpha